MQNQNTPNYSKLSQNPNYGRPSHRKLAHRMEVWKSRMTTFAILRAIHEKLDPEFRRQRALDNTLTWMQ